MADQYGGCTLSAPLRKGDCPRPGPADGDSPLFRTAGKGDSPLHTGGTPGTAAVLQDTTAPTVPEGLTATLVSGSQIDLAWTPSTDSESGVAYYRI